MHLLIILLQQLLGMLPSSKQVPQPEVIRNGGGSNGGDSDAYGGPDACGYDRAGGNNWAGGNIVTPLCGWMTPFKLLRRVALPMRSAAATSPTAAARSPRSLGGNRAGGLAQGYVGGPRGD